MKIKISELAEYLADNIIFDELFIKSEDSFDYFHLILKNYLIELNKKYEKEKNK